MMKLPAPEQAGNPALGRSLEIGPDLDLRLTLVVSPETADPIGVDVRLYRRLPTPEADGPFASTPAGLRLPCRLIPSFVTALVDLGRSPGGGGTHPTSREGFE